MGLTVEDAAADLPAPVTEEPAERAGGVPSGSGGGRSMWPRLAPHLLVLVILLLVGLGELWSVWGEGDPTHTVLCQCGDPGQTVWFMAWVPWAIAHGHNPFFTDAMFAGKGGANLLQSTSYLGPAVVLAPVTWLFGATASFNVALLAAPVLSGWCMFLAVRRVTGHLSGQILAALLWAYSPVVFGAQIYGHLNFAFLYYPPLVFLLVYDLCTGTKPAWRLGLWLGLLTVAEFFTGTEPLAVTAVATAVGGLAAICLAPRRAWALKRRVLEALAVAVVVAGVLLAYPYWFLEDGPRHIVGEPWPLSSWYGYGLGSVIHPGADTHRSTLAAQIGGYYGQTGPASSFIGIALIVFVVVSALVWWRRREAWALLIMGVVAWDFGLGVVILPLTSSSTPWWLLWARFQSLPLVGNIGPNHFAFVVTGVACVLLAVSVDAWADWAAALVRCRAASRFGAGCAAAVAALACVPIATSYTWPLAMTPGSMPKWYWTVARHVDPSTVVLAYPYPGSGAPVAMYWQAVDGFTFRLVGGRAEVPGGDGRHSAHVSSFGGSEMFLEDTSYGSNVPPPPTMATIGGLRSSIAGWDVNDVVVVQRGLAPGWAIATYYEVLGRKPTLTNGAYVWTDVVPELARHAPFVVAPNWFTRCVGTGQVPAQIATTVNCMTVGRP